MMRAETSLKKRSKSATSVAAAVWRPMTAPYHEPNLRRALGQMANTYLPYVLLWVAMIWSLGISYWITLGLILIAAGFLARVFIILHDCGHGSFFKSRRKNDIVGFISGVLSFTPYHYWRYNHAIHHATAGNLDRRGVGDIWTLTVREYQESTPWRRFRYRFYRNPLILFVVGPVLVFLGKQRFASYKAGWRWHRSVLLSNLAMLGVAVGMSAIIGVKAYLLIQLPIICISAIAGVWLFYVQHQFESVYWERQANWDHYATAMEGSSFYKLPKLLQWFSGNIGFHHIHHLSPRIPNYFLEKCHRENPLLQNVTVLPLRESLKSIRYRLWDEERQKLVGVGLSWL